MLFCILMVSLCVLFFWLWFLLLLLVNISFSLFSHLFSWLILNYNIHFFFIGILLSGQPKPHKKHLRWKKKKLCSTWASERVSECVCGLLTFMFAFWQVHLKIFHIYWRCLQLGPTMHTMWSCENQPKWTTCRTTKNIPTKI